MSLYVHRAERTDLLADGLGDLLAASPLDPLTEEVVVVPARGVERWLTQRLSHRLGADAAGRVQAGGDGVCAGVRFLTPPSLVGLLTGRERDDPWQPDRLVWPLLSVLDECLEEPWAQPLARHLGHDTRPEAAEQAELRAGRRYAVARRLAGLFAAYGVQRPGVLTDWRAGRDLDGAGAQLDADLCWQPPLWRRLIQAVDADPPDVRHTITLARLRDAETAGAAAGALDLPKRLSLFGHTRLPVTEVELLAALGRGRDVHLWLPQVSVRSWQDLAVVCASGPVRRRDDRSADHVGHPLLVSLGRDSREVQRALARADSHTTRIDDEIGSEPSAPGSPRRAGQCDTVLAWLQHDLAAGRTPQPQERDRRTVRPGDDSVQVHACHGPARQVEVLREVLVALLEDDPSLEPRDIIVMCPDIEAYAPLVQAGFALADPQDGTEAPGRRHDAHPHPAHRLRVRLADRAMAGTNPLAAVALSLLTLVGGRMTVGDVLDLATTEPVRRRFGFTDDNLEQIGRWVEQAAVRWGFDAAARAPFGLAHVGQNTWRFGLDRLLLGVAVSQEGDPLGAALPVDDVAGGDIDLVGSLVEFVERVGSVVTRLQDARTAPDWMSGLRDGVRDLTDVATDNAWQSAQLDRELTAVEEASRAQQAPTRMRLADVRGLLEHRFAPAPTRANFRTGTLTVSTMVPMRSVPHRVVALLGLDDGVFPRNNTIDGDDVLARDPLTGERDPRSEDRQLLLDAVMAAQEHLVLTYTGAGEHTGAPRPPAVPLEELIDAVRACVPEPHDVVTAHPLQPFDARNFTPGALGRATPFSFDSAAWAGAVAAAATPRTERPALLSAPLAPPAPADLDLGDLIGFVAHPGRDFLRNRLDVGAPLAADEPADAMPVALDALEKWSVGDRLLNDALRSVPAAQALHHERLRGLLPPRALAEPVLADLGAVVGALVQTAEPLRRGNPATLDIDVDLGSGRHLLGTVPEVYEAHEALPPRHVTVGYSSLSPKRRLESWITVLALTLAYPEHPWRGYVVARRGSRAVCAVSGPVAPERAREILSDLVDSYDRARCEPLPMPSRTAFAYAQAFLSADPDTDPVREAAREWHTSPDRENAPPGESADPWNARIYGPNAPLEVLLTPPDAQESWNAAPHRLGQYAVRLWEPVLRGGQEIR